MIKNSKDIKSLGEQFFLNSIGYVSSQKLRKCGIKSEELYEIFHEEDYNKLCFYCSNKVKFIKYSKGMSDVCSSIECSNQKRKNFCLEKYGVENPTQNEEIKEKISSTLKSKTPEEKKKIREKVKATTFARHGVISFFELEETQEKIKATNNLKYGCDHQLQRPEIHQKSRETKKERYGDENYNNPDSTKATTLVRYGYSHISRKDEKNLEDLNKDFCVRFIKETEKGLRTDLQAFCRYFNISTSFCRNKMKEFGMPVSINHKKNMAEMTIQNIVPSSKTNDRQIIKPLEIDVLSHEHKMGVEYNGLMWHSEGASKYKLFDNNVSNPERHLKKSNLMEEKGYYLFQVFEDEFKRNKHAWISTIRNEIGLNTKIPEGVYKVQDLSQEENTNFLSTNSINIAPENYKLKAKGFYVGDVLIFVINYAEKGKMVFIKDSVLKNNLSFSESFTVFIKHFLDKINKTTVIKLDRRYADSPGAIKTLESLGFDYHKTTKPIKLYFNYDLKITLKQPKNTNSAENLRIIYNCGYRYYIKKSTN